MYYIKLKGIDHIKITNPKFNDGKVTELHITLGYPNKRTMPVDGELKGIVRGTHTLRLEKWSPRPESTTYKPIGTLHALCVTLSDVFGFRPRREWHVSL